MRALTTNEMINVNGGFGVAAAMLIGASVGATASASLAAYLAPLRPYHDHYGLYAVAGGVGAVMGAGFGMAAATAGIAGTICFGAGALLPPAVPLLLIML